MYILGLVILVFFAVIGLAVFVSTLVKANLQSNTDGFILLIPQADEDNAEARIRSAAALVGSAHGCRLICVCKNEHGARMICEKMQREFPYLEIANQFEVL